MTYRQMTQVYSETIEDYCTCNNNHVKKANFKKS